MPKTHPLTAILAISLISCGTNLAATPAPQTGTPRSDSKSTLVTDLVDYVRSQKSTGFLVIQHGHTLVEKNWPASADDKLFKLFDYGQAPDGSLFEDVASQQKSFVSVMIGMAIDKGLIDVRKPVDDYLGKGWTKATPEQEAKIRVIDVLTMSSGLDEKFQYEAPAGTKFFYNTPVYATSKRILVAASGLSLDQITKQWLTDPLGMSETDWRQRPSTMSNVGNNTGLVTTPRDTAKFGEMVLHHGKTADGKQLISRKSLAALFQPSRANPAYGRLWWLNGSDYTIAALSKRKSGELIPAAPQDLVAALGYLDRRLYVVPSLDLVIVRTGAAAPDKDFDQQLWLRLMRIVG